MATASFRTGELTFEDFVEMVPDGQKADLLDGVIFMASPDNLRVNKLNVCLAGVMQDFADQRDLGEVFASRVAYRMGDNRAPEPDVGFLAKKQKAAQHFGFVQGPPTLAVEIVSPDSVDRDYVHKRRIYEEAGVKEYWIIDPDEQRATFLVLERGRFRERKPVRSIWRSKVIPGFWLDVRWFWDDERPNAHKVLQLLLSE